MILLVGRQERHLACSLILSRIDYCNAVLYGAPMTTINKLQHVQNNAASFVLQIPKRTYAKPLLEKLHRLPVEQRIRYKIAYGSYPVLKLGADTAGACSHVRFVRRVNAALGFTPHTLPRRSARSQLTGLLASTFRTLAIASEHL